MTKRTSKIGSRRMLAAAIECIGIAVIGVGIGCELTLGGSVYLVIITSGSTLVAIGSLLWAKVKY